MRKNLLTCALGLAATAALAQTGNAVSLNRWDGSAAVIPTAALRAMTFGDGTLVCHRTDGAVEQCSLADLRSVTFVDAIENGLAAVRQEGRGLISVAIGADGVARIVGLGDAPTEMSLHAADGTLLRRAVLSSSAGFQIADLARGVYVLSIDGQTLKFLKP